MRRVQRVGSRRGGGNAAVLIDRETTRTAGSDVKAEKLGQSSSPILPMFRYELLSPETTSVAVLTLASRAVR